MPYETGIKGMFEGVLNQIEKKIYETAAELKVTAWVTPEPVSYEERMTGNKKELTIGQKWGDLWDCAWFNFKGEVPQTAKGKNVVLLIDISGEACIVDEEGNPLQGLTNVNSEFAYELGRPGKRVVWLFDKAEGKEKIDIWADAGCNDLFGKYKGNGTLKEAFIAICNEGMRELYYDFNVLHDLMKYLPEDTARYHSIFCALADVCRLMNDFSDDEANKAREILKKELDKKTGDHSLTVSAIGHAHIDLAWLWPIRETIRKGARTFSTALKMMERYPDYVFGASQPQLYQWVKERYPALYERVKEKINQGRWEAQGGMWVEADTNVSGGEALVRQVLYGKRFFRKEFDKDMKILWLPDVFGYSGALPQILKKSGIDYFMTIKLSWSSYNKHPHHTFVWQGIDGSSVLAHMPPEGTYNSSGAPRAIIQSEKNFMDKGYSDRCLVLFGIGDGGGGPGEEHLENMKREKSLNGIAPVVQEPALDFFKYIDKDSHRYKTWTGELYLEFHRGTYTTQAKNKKFNRKMELKLRELEFASVLANLLVDFKYPAEEIEEIWKEVLLYQFHDILPGSSIDRVYTESLERYEFLMNRVCTLIGQTCSRIAEKINTNECSRPVVLMNSLSWDRDEWVNTDGNWLKTVVPAMGYTVVDSTSSQSMPDYMKADERTLENDLFVIGFNEDGSIKSVFDKEYQREVIASGIPANRLAVYQDWGDAWDFPYQYDQKQVMYFKIEKSEAFVEGPRAVLRQTYKFGQSSLKQEIILTAGSRRIDFSTNVDWHESQKMLRTAFPVDVYATEAACEIQFGSINRPTHRNTTWDMAKFEICAHKYVDLSQGDYGVALLNDSKYGYKVLGNVIDLNLLRSSKYPGENADIGYHEFTYSLYPHMGDHIAGRVSRAGYELNVPLGVVNADSHQGVIEDNKSFISVDSANIIVEAVKKAEDSNDIIVRLFECSGAGAKTNIHFDFNVKSVQLVDLMEENGQELTIDKNSVEVCFKPFEIHTLKVML